MADGVYIRRCQLYMTPKTQDSHACLARRSHVERRCLSAALRVRTRKHNKTVKMTLCGSEVPQDRWRGRTAGSGMWTLTRDNLLSWSLDDPAITYG